MLDHYAELYPKIAADLDRALPHDWRQAWMSNASPAWITPPLRLYERFREMNDAARNSSPEQPWTTATFILQRDGTFDVDFGYGSTSIEEEQDRLEAWKRRYLPS